MDTLQVASSSQQIISVPRPDPGYASGDVGLVLSAEDRLAYVFGPLLQLAEMDMPESLRTQLRLAAAQCSAQLLVLWTLYTKPQIIKLYDYSKR